MKKRFLLVMLLIWSIIIVNAQENQDQANAFDVCQSKTFYFDKMQGYGEVLESTSDNSCFDFLFQETNSKWLHWKTQTDGKLIFTLLPNSDSDDLDFILFKATSNQSLTSIRCMASGQSLNKSMNPKCNGPTGLAYTSSDVAERKGCQYTDDSFLKYLDMQAGDEYFLLVNNYNSNSGFTMTFESGAQLEGSKNCELNSEEQILQLQNIYPIPAQDVINLNYTKEEGSSIDFSIFDTSGNRHSTFTEDSQNSIGNIIVNIQNLGAGEYILVANQNGTKATKQFIKI